MKRVLIVILFIFVIGCNSPDVTETLVAEPSAVEEPAVQAEPINNTIEPVPVVEEAKIPQETWTQQKVSCEGELFDSHAHYDGLAGGGHGQDGLKIKDLSKQMKQHRIGCAVLFVSSLNIDAQFEQMREDLAVAEVGFQPFFPLMIKSHFSTNYVDVGYKGREDAFYGIGEITFYQGDLVGTSLEVDPWPAIFEYAAEHNLVIMIHPTEMQADDIEKMLKKYPNTKVLLHGFQILNTNKVESLLKEHKNLYWTYDVATMLDGFLYRINNAQDFLAWYGMNKQRYLSSSKTKLVSLMKAAPDRVLWGTDVVANWHVQPEVYSEIIDFSNDLIDSLPVEYQDKYAYANAQKLFGKGVQFKKN